MLGSFPSRSSSSSRIASGPSGASGSWLVVGLLHPVRAVLGAEVHEQQARRTADRCRPTPRSKASLPPSSQWRSSIKMTTGDSARPVCIRRRRTPKSRRCRASGSIWGAGRSGSGTPRKSKSSGSARGSSRPGATSCRRSSRAPRDRRPAPDPEVRSEHLENRQERNGSSRAQPPVPSKTRSPSARHRSANSKQRRLLPTPASPTTPTTWPFPSRHCARAASSVAISSPRPTKRESPRWRDTSKRVRSSPIPSSSKTRTGSLTPFDGETPEIRQLEVALDQRGGALGQVGRSGSRAAPCAAASPTVCPWAV